MFVVCAYEGQKVRVGDRLLTVGPVVQPGVVHVTVDGEHRPTSIMCDRMLELFPEVRVSMERNISMSKRVKLLFDAPRRIHIRELPYDPSP